MRRLARVTGGVLAAATATSALVLSPLSLSSAAPAFCSQQATYPGTTITWTGGHGHDWSNPANWSTNAVPDAGQTPATYQPEYVCIGSVGGTPAGVTIGGSDSYHLAGIDVGQGAQLTLAPGARLFLGAAQPADVVPSYVERHSTLSLDAAMLGGNGPLTVAGTMRWSGERIAGRKLTATQTSSECVADPTIPQCPGDTTPGGGKTRVTSHGRLLVTGSGFGGVTLGDGRVIDNSGTLRLTGAGYVAMNNATTLIDRPGSRLELLGAGGIIQGVPEGSSARATLTQSGSLLRDGSGRSVIGVPTTLSAPGSHEVRVTKGELAVDVARTAPKARLARGTIYGIGSCRAQPRQPCRAPEASPDAPQVALVGTSTQAPKVSHVAVRLAPRPRKVHGHRVVGRSVVVNAPHKRTTHATHLTFGYDASLRGVKGNSHPSVYRNGHRITYCRVHGITALNPSCVFSAGIAHSGAATKGDLTVTVITIRPKATWSVA